MDYEVREPPKEEPLTLSDTKIYLRTIAGETVEDNAVIEPLITAAREFAENVTGRALAKQTIAAYPTEFEQTIQLPRAPVNSIKSITAIGEDGTRVEISADDYLLSSMGDVYMLRIPDIRVRAARPIEIVYEAGYSTPPKLIRQAMLLLIGHWYINREAVIAGSTTAVEVPLAARTLLNQYKRWWC